MNPEEPTATEEVDAAVAMETRPSVMQSYFKIHLSQDETEQKRRIQ